MKETRMTTIPEFAFVNYIPKEARGIGVACILIQPGKGIYLTERAKGGEFGCPGGKVEDTDFSLEDSMRRELLEETGLNFEENRLHFLGYQKVTTEATDYTCWYIVTLKPGEIPINKEPTKHGEWRAYMLKESLKLPLFCGTKPTLEALIKQIKSL